VPPPPPLLCFLFFSRQVVRYSTGEMPWCAVDKEKQTPSEKKETKHLERPQFGDVIHVVQ
jgi:hypothetical protein